MALRKAGISEIFSGLGGLAVMAGLYFFTGSRIFIFIGIFAGVLPAIRGISKILQARVDHQDRERLAVPGGPFHLALEGGLEEPVVVDSRQAVGDGLHLVLLVQEGVVDRDGRLVG